MVAGYSLITFIMICPEREDFVPVVLRHRDSAVTAESELPPVATRSQITALGKEVAARKAAEHWHDESADRLNEATGVLAVLDVAEARGPRVASKSVATNEAYAPSSRARTSSLSNISALSSPVKTLRWLGW